MNPSLSEESPAFPDVMEDTGPIEQIYSIKTEDAGPIENRYSIKTEDARPIEQIFCIIKTEDDLSLERDHYSVQIEDAASVEQLHHSIQTKDAASVEQEFHSVQRGVATSAEEEGNMKVRSLETYCNMPSTMELLIYHPSVYYFLYTLNYMLIFYVNVYFRLIPWMKTLLLLALHFLLESDRIMFSQPPVKILLYLLVAT